MPKKLIREKLTSGFTINIVNHILAIFKITVNGKVPELLSSIVIDEETFLKLSIEGKLLPSTHYKDKLKTISEVAKKISSGDRHYQNYHPELMLIIYRL